MAIPSFGPSQRLEISRKYLNYNESCTSDYQLYGPINPKNNVAEEGQVVLLWSGLVDCHGGTQRRTEVIPDAAGYPIDINTDIPDRIKESYLEQELSKYNVGVNQVERCIGKSHSSAGFGWDISFTPGHPVVIKHTGCEPIYRFDMIGIRFPNKQDVESQQSIWGSAACNGNCISKFATYPIRENFNMMKHGRFIRGIQILKENIERGLSNDSNSSLQYLQIPAMIKLLCELFKYLKKDDMVDIFEETVIELENKKFSSYDKLLSRDSLQLINGISKAACEFVETLNPPFILAQCIDFKCTQSHSKSQAECGDSMKCVLL